MELDKGRVWTQEHKMSSCIISHHISLTLHPFNSCPTSFSAPILPQPIFNNKKLWHLNWLKHKTTGWWGWGIMFQSSNNNKASWVIAVANKLVALSKENELNASQAGCKYWLSNLSNPHIQSFILRLFRSSARP